MIELYQKEKDSIITHLNKGPLKIYYKIYK